MEQPQTTPPKFFVSDDIIWGFSRPVPNAATTTASLAELAAEAKRIVLAWARSENLAVIAERVEATPYHIHEPATHAAASAPGALFYLCCAHSCNEEKSKNNDGSIAV